ncbi:cytokine receptor [Cydia amplana]|uniref:cytokine receptor n=1 Tax=Cydia amplana TaxID=1869771 RepID=UPI002FE54F21
MERRTKNSGLRKGPHLSSWIWCMFIKVFCLPCIFSECFGNNITLSVQPPGDRRIFYGNPLEIFCVAEGGDVAEDLELLVNHVQLNTTIVNETTIRWYEERPEKQSTTFYCNNKRTNKKCSSKVVVDGYPQEVEEFTCLSKNLNELNCSWVPPKGNQLVVNYNLTFLVNDRAVLPCKVHDEVNASWCVWTTKTGPGVPLYRQQLDMYYFNLTSYNSFGSISQNFAIDHFSIVKPDPPTALEVVQNDSRSVTIQWKISNNMVDLLKGGVDHRIEYQISEIDNTTYFHKVDASDLPPKNRTYKYELSLPFAHWEYEVRIYIKPKKAKLDQYWSDYAFIMINTTSEKPPRPPKIAAGSFHQQPYLNHRLLKIYWSQLSDVEEAGANFTYRVVVWQGNKQQTLSPDNKSLSYVSLNASDDPLQVMVWSENDKGLSEDYSSLYIPSEDNTQDLHVESFTKLTHENGTNELSWQKINHNKIDNYTLFWCELKTTQTCTGRMNFTTLSPHISKHSINLPSTLYQFAISANKGFKSSGMTWAYCDIPKKGMEWYQIPVSLSHDSKSVDTTHVNLTWAVQCTFSAGFLRGYIIYYCPVIETSASCYDNRNYTKHIDNPDQKSVLIENLLPYTTYQFTIALDTASGIRQHNNTDRVTTLEDTPSSPTNIRIRDISHDSVNITWDPPEYKNGKILYYNITKTLSDGTTDYVIEDTFTHRQITGLQGLTNYTFAVKACNNAKNRCSSIVPKDGIHVRTRIGPPGRINSAPLYNYSLGTINWFAPGHVDLYQVMILKNKKEYELSNTTDLYIDTVACQGDEMSYQVRAINYDADQYHGVMGDPDYVELPVRTANGIDEYVGEWSQTYNMPCGQSGGLTLTLIILGVFLIVGVGYGSLKLYKKMKQMEDIKPVFPNGLNVPEKDLTKYGFGGWTQTNKDEKPSSDEMLLLPNSKSSISPVSPNVKQSIDNCDSSDHTDSTALSNNSEGHIDRQSSISDTASDSSLRDIEQGRDENASQGEASASETESSRESSPYLNDVAFKKNPNSGYVQSVMNPNTDLSSPSIKSPQEQAKSPVAASSSYVMAGLPPPIFTTGLLPSSPPPAGYVRADDPQARLMNLPKLGPSPTKLFGPESLPTLPLPSPKKGEGSSYIQLQCLESVPNLKVREQPKPAASGYVSPEDAVLNKHLNNMMAARAPVPDTPILLDPDMSPDAYCRFSWSKDPSIDNFNSILVDSSLTTPKN